MKDARSAVYGVQRRWLDDQRGPRWSSFLLAWILVLAAPFGAWAEDGDASSEDSSANDSASSEASCSQADCRETFSAYLDLGLVINTFAAEDLRLYLNPDDSGGVESDYAAGVEFEYRLTGDPAEPSQDQIWVFGATEHSVRGTDVDCAANPDLAVCQLASDPGSVGTGDTAGDAFLYILNNATSLEAGIGLRWEFAAINLTTDSPARFYLKPQIGFFDVEGSDDDLKEQTFLGVGLTTTSGKFQGSFLEAGVGTSEIYTVDDESRFMINAQLNWTLTQSVGAYARMHIDTGDGADSVRSFIGFRIDPGSLFSGGS